MVNVFGRLTTASPGLAQASGGGGGDASLAEQQAQTGLLTTIDADTGTIAAAIRAEDSPHSSGHTGMEILCVRKDTAASMADTDGDYAPCLIDSTGRLYTRDATTADISVRVGSTTDAPATPGSDGSLNAKLKLLTTQLDTLNTAISTLSGKLPSAASMAEDTATPSVSKIQTFPMVHDGTNWDFMGKAAAESTGVQIVRPHALLADRVSNVVGITDGSSTSVVAAQGSGVRFCATTIVVSNSSATNVTVDIRDGTAGSVLMTIPAAANMGGGVIPLAVPLCTSANTIFAADPSASASTVTITAVGFKTTL
ncbi:MAG: hypothetical protein HRU82_02545 [Nitrospira sp.]|nr:MAG: hypothetical protein HRU82_02545 [Nitrospira sp.]